MTKNELLQRKLEDAIQDLSKLSRALMFAGVGWPVRRRVLEAGIALIAARRMAKQEEAGQ